MAGWVCQTRKLLQSAIASIADELEHTVQNFNDAVQNLSRPSDSSSGAGDEQTAPDSTDGAQMAEQAQDLEYNLAAAQMLELCKPNTHHRNDEDFFVSPHSLPTTRQPETTGFASVLNSRLSQSSPSLHLPQLPESYSSPELIPRGRSTGKASKFRSLAYRPTSPSNLTLSSPCLIHISRSARPVQTQQLNDTQRQYSEPQPRQTEHFLTASDKPTHSKTAQSLESSRLRQGPDLLKSFGHKLPGKVVRADMPTTTDDPCEGGSFSLSEKESGSLENPTLEGSTKLSSAEHNGKNQEPKETRLVKASFPVLVERETHILRWLSLAPITRMLSFAFSQFANAVLKLTEEELHGQSSGNQSPAPRQLLALTNHASGDVPPEMPVIHRRSSNDADNIPEGQDLYSSLLRSTYSTESFEIIERSCFDEFQDPAENNVAQCNNPRRHPQLDSSSHTSDVLTSSAEFVNFDFRDLIANRQFNQLNPVASGISHGALNNENMYKSYVLIGDKGPDILVTFDKKNVDENDDAHLLGERPSDDIDDDEDDDGSVSFTILSSENDEEFIMF